MKVIDKVKKEQMHKIAPLFKGWDETLIWSCLEGVLGHAWVDDIKKPRSAQIIATDFCFFAGVPNEDLVNNYPKEYTPEYILVVPQNQNWQSVIEATFEGKYEKFKRYAIKKEEGIFDKTALKNNLKGLPCGYVLKKIDESIYEMVMSEDWSISLCGNFDSYEDFNKLGRGYVILHNDKVVCGASSYSVYSAGIEIEIDTIKEHRRKGLAFVCASKLILECLEHGLYPSWDAANTKSVSLAEKLGYHFDREYVTYELPMIKADMGV